MSITRTTIIAAICSCALLAGCASAVTSPPRSVAEQILQLTPGLEVEFDPSSNEAPPPYTVHHFAYRQVAGVWPYGRGFAVAHTAASSVLWIYLHHGDYPPHELRWADFDGDGRRDIFFHAGGEEVFTTAIYLNRVTAGHFGLSQFVLGYENSKVYATVVDFAGDGRPELIVAEPYPGELDPCIGQFREFERNDSESRAAYHFLAGPFDEFNFRFGGSGDDFAGFDLFDRVEVVSVGGELPTPAVRDHVRWRIDKIHGTISRFSAECQDRLLQTVEHLHGLLRE